MFVAGKRSVLARTAFWRGTGAKANSSFARNGSKYPLSQIRTRNIPCVFQARHRAGLAIVSYGRGVGGFAAGTHNGVINGEVVARIW
jgi:hypothetical protein